MTITQDPFYMNIFILQDLPDITEDMDPAEYRGDDVTREEMMQILSNLERLMIRGRYHTVQVESV